MKYHWPTASLCTTCYREVPATVEVNRTEVLIRKVCPEHGDQVGLLEKDPVFYSQVKAQRSPSIYAGYFLDVTRTCQLRCFACYYPLEKKDPEKVYAKEMILSDAKANAHLGPIILTGGEPTLHPDLPELLTEISKFTGVELLSNGVKLSEPEYFGQIMPLITHNVRGSQIANLNLSIHADQTDKWMKVIELCRGIGLKIESALIVVDSRDSFERAVLMAQALKDVVVSFRIKAATAIWNEKKPVTSTVVDGEPPQKIFVSDMLDWLQQMGGSDPIIIQERMNKSVFVNVFWGGIVLMLVSWHDTANVDLMDIECAPYYRARNGEVRNMVTAMLINEGWDKGFCKGAHTFH